MAEATVEIKPDTIVMIHGLWMTPRSWEHWKERYEARGYTVHAPAWPGFEVEVEALTADPWPMNDLSAETVSTPTRHSSRPSEQPDHHGSSQSARVTTQASCAPCPRSSRGHYGRGSDRRRGRRASSPGPCGCGTAR